MGEVNLVQYIFPNGIRKNVTCQMPDDVCKMAENQILSCECGGFLDKVTLYSRKLDWLEEDEIIYFADNGGGENQPSIVLESLIRKVHSMKK
jgi:hypothetical protein